MLSFDLACISKRCFGGLSGCLVFCKSQPTALKATLYACIGLYTLATSPFEPGLKRPLQLILAVLTLWPTIAFSKRLIPAVSIVMGLNL